MHRPETRRPSIPQAARFRGPPRSPVPLSGGGGRSRTPLTSVRRPQAAHPGLRQQRHGGQPGLRRGEGGVLQPGGARVRPRPRQRRHLRLRLQEVGTRGRGWHMRAHTHSPRGQWLRAGGDPTSGWGHGWRCGIFLKRGKLRFGVRGVGSGGDGKQPPRCPQRGTWPPDTDPAPSAGIRWGTGRRGCRVSMPCAGHAVPNGTGMAGATCGQQASWGTGIWGSVKGGAGGGGDGQRKRGKQGPPPLSWQCSPAWHGTQSVTGSTPLASTVPNH